MSRYSLAGRTVVITGSTGGLGSAVAHAVRARGANVALLDLDQPAVDRQAADLGPANIARGWSADVRDLDSLDAAISGAAQHFGRIDAVIANAGVAGMATLETIDPTAWERIVDINLNGVWRTFRSALPHVTATKGYLLAVSSMAAFVHSPLQGPYVASKAGVWALCNATRLELRHLGVGVGSVHPTFFKTPMMDEAHADPAGVTLWGGNTKGPWKMLPIETVVEALVSGVEKRSDFIVPGGRNKLVARVPGIFRPLVERIGFRGDTIPRAAAQTGAS